MKLTWSLIFEYIVRRNCPLLNDQDPLAPDRDLADLGMSSMHTVSCLTEFEEEFGIELDFDELSFDAFRTAATLWEAISSITDTATRS